MRSKVKLKPPFFFKPQAYTLQPPLKEKKKKPSKIGWALGENNECIVVSPQKCSLTPPTTKIKPKQRDFKGKVGK